MRSQHAPSADAAPNPSRRLTRAHIERRATVAREDGDPVVVIDMLNAALATKLACVMRYKRHYYMAHGLAEMPVADEFLQRANEELGHADALARRITQLNGAPSFDPAAMLARSLRVASGALVEILREDLIAERVAVDSYREMIRYLGPQDPTTRQMLEGILATEERHAQEMSELLARHTPRTASA